MTLRRRRRSHGASWSATTPDNPKPKPEPKPKPYPDPKPKSNPNPDQVGNNPRGGAAREPQGDIVPDVLRFSTDGFASSKHCSCSEKTRFWFSYALRRWPSVSWIAKTEDDTYLHLGKLLADLGAPQMEPSRAAADGHVMYGLMNLCTATPYSQTAAGCFLGDMESQSTVLASMSKSRSPGCKAFPAAPFPTGPLAVMSAGLAREVFERCEYMQGYSAAAAALGGTCLNSRVGKTFLNLNACDCAIGGWIQQCVPTLSLGSMTWTKGHHNAQTGGGLGWVRPDDQSIAVHYLKTDAAVPWQAAHNASRDTAVPAFPPIMWQYDNPANGHPSVRVAEGSKALQAWYSRTCRHAPASFVQQYARERRGGSPYSWGNFGCHRVRGHPTPVPENDANYRKEDANYRRRLPQAEAQAALSGSVSPLEASEG